MDHPSQSHIAHLILKGLSIGTVSALTHPIAYPISAAALLCQANVVYTSDVYRIILYAFSKAKNLNLFLGGGKATVIKTFISVAAVAIEDIWTALVPLQLSRNTTMLVSKFAGLLFNVAVNGPLDVIRTRLALQEFGQPNQVQSTMSSEYSKIVSKEGYMALYSGWQVMFLQFILDYLIQKWDTKSQRQRGSIVQLFPMVIKFVTDYAFTVIKIRANMKNDGIFSIMKSVVSQRGLRGFMAGWKIHLLLFPLVMINMILANILFLQFKKLLFPTPHPRPPWGGDRGAGLPPPIGGIRRSGEGQQRTLNRNPSVTAIQPPVTPIDVPNNTSQPASPGVAEPSTTSQPTSPKIAEPSTTSQPTSPEVAEPSITTQSSSSSPVITSLGASAESTTTQAEEPASDSTPNTTTTENTPTPTDSTPTPADIPVPTSTSTPVPIITDATPAAETENTDPGEK